MIKVEKVDNNWHIRIYNDDDFLMWTSQPFHTEKKAKEYKDMSLKKGVFRNSIPIKYKMDNITSTEGFV